MFNESYKYQELFEKFLNSDKRCEKIEYEALGFANVNSARSGLSAIARQRLRDKVEVRRFNSEIFFVRPGFSRLDFFELGSDYGIANLCLNDYVSQSIRENLKRFADGSDDIVRVPKSWSGRVDPMAFTNRLRRMIEIDKLDKVIAVTLHKGDVYLYRLVERTPGYWNDVHPFVK